MSPITSSLLTVLVLVILQILCANGKKPSSSSGTSYVCSLESNSRGMKSVTNIQNDFKRTFGKDKYKIDYTEPHTFHTTMVKLGRWKYGRTPEAKYANAQRMLRRSRPKTITLGVESISAGKDLLTIKLDTSRRSPLAKARQDISRVLRAKNLEEKNPHITLAYFERKLDSKKLAKWNKKQEDLLNKKRIQIVCQPKLAYWKKGDITKKFCYKEAKKCT